MTTDISALIAERFKDDTSAHEMTVLHDDGLHRQIRCRSPKNSSYWFDLITWPGYLAFVGDGTAYVFARTPDMFEFFRGSAWKGRPNLSYWAEKVVTDREPLREYSVELFTAQVSEALSEAEEDYPGITAAWEKQTTGYWADYNLEYEPEAREAMDRFEFGTVFKVQCSCGQAAQFEDETRAILWHCTTTTHVKSGKPQRVEGFRFYDTSDLDFQDYRWWFVWACYAIIWGIAAYDKAKPEPDATEEHF